MLPASVCSEPTSNCKCCGQTARLFDVCDFNKSCEEVRGTFLPYSGIPVYYYKCSQCGFIFTRIFDDFRGEDFVKHIYNEAYVTVDPDFERVRPQKMAELVNDLFSGAKRDLAVLDYGGGDGYFAERLSAAGFKSVVNYEPFFGKPVADIGGDYNLITCFEVVEHATDPHKIFSDMASVLDQDNGMILFSTALTPPEIDVLKTAWWYIGPRNGHISIHTERSLGAVLSRLGLRMFSANKNYHFAFKRVPAFASHLPISGV